MRQPRQRRLVDAPLPELGPQHHAQMRIGSRHPAARLCRVEPAEIVADQQLAAAPRRQHVLDQRDDPGIFGPSHMVVFDPGAAFGDREVEPEVSLLLSVDRNEAFGPPALGLDDVELLHHHPALDRVAADHRARRARCPCGRPQDLRLERRDAVIAGTELDPARPVVGLVETLGQLAQHPGFEFDFAGRAHPLRDPWLAVVAGGHDDRELRLSRYREVQVGPPSHTPGGTLDQRSDAERIKTLGVTALVECATGGVGRRADLDLAVSRETQFPIVVPTGNYREPWIPEWVRTASEVELEAWMLRELTERFDEADYRAGWIKLSAGDDGITPLETKILRAATRASCATGAVIGSHTIKGRVVMEQLDIIEAEGGRADRFISIHTQEERAFGLNLAVAERGAWIEYDHVGRAEDAGLIALIE